MAWNPAHSIIKKLGGEAVVSEATGTAYTAPYRWQSDISKGGTGGRIPGRHIPTLLEFAKSKSIPLPVEEFHVDPTPVERSNGAAA